MRLEQIIIAYVIFQIITYAIIYFSVTGEKIIRGYNKETLDFLLLIGTIPIINIITFWIILKRIHYIKTGANAHKELFHYIVIALPVLSLLSLFFVEI